MIRIFIFDYHRDLRNPNGRKIMAKIKDLEGLGIKLNRYYHWYFKPDFKWSNLYRVWVEFDTEEEAAIFKLTYL